MDRVCRRTDSTNRRDALAKKKCDDGRPRAINAVCPVGGKARKRQSFACFSGSLTGTCRDVLTTRGLPSCRLWLLSVSRTRKNFSESIVAPHLTVSEDLSRIARLEFNHLIAMTVLPPPDRLLHPF
ncbi:MAG: hypothetical protein U1E61_06280 [Bradyrhizobium sp.]